MIIGAFKEVFGSFSCKRTGKEIVSNPSEDTKKQDTTKKIELNNRPVFKETQKKKKVTKTLCK